MYRIFLFIFLLTFSCVSLLTARTSDQKVLEELDGLVSKEDFFKLKTAFENKKDQLSAIHSLYYSSLLHNLFNQPATSNEEISQLLAMSPATLSATRLNKLYHTKLQNHLNLYEYAVAAQTSEYLLTHFRAQNDSIQIETLENEIKMWRALKDVPRQEIFKNQDVTLPLIKDKVGLLNLEVGIADQSISFLFDTGANLSLITESKREELNMELIPADFYVTAATGVRLPCDLALAKELKLGDLVFHNVVFLVLPDAQLSFPQIDYYPNGAIGFPVIRAMEEVRFQNGNQLYIPQNPTPYSYNNFALNGLMPIVGAHYDRDTLNFNFDTGANSTTLYQPFFEKYQDKISGNFEKQTFSSGGAGGKVEFEGYILPEFHLTIADSEAELKEVRLHAVEIGKDASLAHGNFGQDYIQQFDEMILSFRYSSVVFR